MSVSQSRLGKELVVGRNRRWRQEDGFTFHFVCRMIRTYEGKRYKPTLRRGETKYGLDPAESNFRHDLRKNHTCYTPTWITVSQENEFSTFRREIMEHDAGTTHAYT